MNTAAFLGLYGLAFILLAAWLQRHRDAAEPVVPAFGRWHLLGWLAVGVALRLPLLWDTGFHYDTGTYKAWALAASNPEDPLNLYKEGYFADYPPFYMYVLGLLGTVARLLDWGTSPHFTALVKLPALLCDAATSLLLLRELRRELGERRGWTLASLYWFNPALIFTGALWGQTEALLCLMIVGGWLAWRGGRIKLAAVIFAAAVAFKPQGALYAGVFGIAVIIGGDRRQIAAAALTGIATFALIVLKFAWTRPWDWLPSLYLSTAGTYDYITVNAYNLWALLGWNWEKDVGSPLGLPMQTWAMIDAAGLILATAIWLGWRLRTTATPQARGELTAWAFVLATVAFFMIAPRMHERYILMALPALLLIGPPQLRMPLFLAWTGAALANIAYVYHWYIDLKTIAPRDTAFIRISSAANVVIALLTVLWWQMPDWPQRLAARLPRLPRFAAMPETAPERSAWSLRHGSIVTAFIIAAMAIGLYRVGAGDYPVTGMSSDGFTLEYRYDEPVVATHALIYTGEKAPGDTPAKLRLERFENRRWIEVIAERELNDFYRLYEIRLDNLGASTRYRWHTSGKDWTLNELGLLDVAGAPLPPQSMRTPPDQADADFHMLADETGTWKRDLGFLASTYFDEIYHGRTGYEFLHRLPIYETTHPPLGKWFISFGIDAFGMTPTGWRFAGILSSALTVGVLAWAGWLFAGSITAMLVTGALGLFEFSRFTIGRYATIDSFLGLFVLLSVLFLWRQFGLRRHDDWRDGWRLSPDLVAAGALLGAAIAVKWSALYGGIGVFLFFVFSVASGLLRDGAQRWQRLAPRVLGACVAFGVAPAAVYIYSYTPFLRSLEHAPALLSVDGLREILKSQRDILDYHARLTSTHPFSSPFWTWPLNLKPMWIFTGETQPRTAISILGNPLIWWGGLVVLVIAVWQNLKRVRADELLLFGAIASLYLPWALVDRATFNYHYYPAALVLIVLVGKRLVEWSRYPRLRNLPGIAALLAGLLFVWFYPTISGHPAPDAWFKSLRWLPTWWML